MSCSTAPGSRRCRPGWASLELARLAAAGARPAGPSPLLAGTGTAVEVERTVNACGLVGLAGAQVNVGYQLAGQRVIVRMDGTQMMVITGDGELARTMPCPVPAGDRHRLRGARKAAASPPPPSGPVTVQRRVSSRGGIMVATQKIQVGLIHAGKIVTVTAEDHTFRLVIDGQAVGVVPRTTSTRDPPVQGLRGAPAPGKAVNRMPELRLDAVDAAELAELLQFLSRLAGPRSRAASAPPWRSSSATPPTTSASCARTWTGSPSCSAATTASPCSAPTRQVRPRDRDQPAARAQEHRRRRLRRRSSPGAPRRLRGRPSGLQGAAHRAGARQPCGLPWTPETTAAPGARKSGQAQACPRAARGAQTPAVAGHEQPDASETAELAFDSHKKRENYKPRVVSRIK